MRIMLLAASSERHLSRNSALVQLYFSIAVRDMALQAKRFHAEGLMLSTPTIVCSHDMQIFAAPQPKPASGVGPGTT